MRKRIRTATLTINMTLPKDFAYTVDDVMQDEYKKACDKWELSLNSVEKKNIMNHAKKQFESKVSNFSKTSWTLNENLLKVDIATTIEGNREINLPSDSAEEYSFIIHKTHDEFVITDEINEKIILPKDFYNYYIDKMLTWARTAVFYCVGSYL